MTSAALPRTTRAAVLNAFNGDFVVQEVPLPELENDMKTMGEVDVRLGSYLVDELAVFVSFGLAPTLHAFQWLLLCTGMRRDDLEVPQQTPNMHGLVVGEVFGTGLVVPRRSACFPFRQQEAVVYCF